MLNTSAFNRKFFILALALLISWSVSAMYLIFMADRTAANETIRDGRNKAKLAAISIQPYVLAQDNISLNYLLNSLNEDRMVEGTLIVGPSKNIIARTGQPSETLQEVQLGAETSRIGTLTLYLSDKHRQTLMRGIIWQGLTLTGVIMISILLIIWFLLQPTALLPESEPDTAEKKPASDQEASLIPDHALTQDQSSSANDAEAEPSSTDQVELSTEAATSEEPTEDAVNKSSKEDEYFETSEAVTPEPPIQVSLEDPTTEDSNNETVLTSDLTADSTTDSVSDNPLKTERAETQLDLYSLEHQLELSLPPEEAAYLLFIDSNSGHAEFTEPTEFDKLISTYEKLLKKTANIYGGDIYRYNNGNLELLLNNSSEDDEHGIHAVCAAKLFLLLYKAYNHSRIKAFKPVLNLHIALVRGNKAKIDMVKEEALFLTRSTQTNELISHTALTEAQRLKSSVLVGAETKREDEDKVLISSLRTEYQTLLTQQAAHILSKKSDL